MLLLPRRTGETIQIGEDITVTVLSTKGNQVRIGITAPDDIKIMRQELLDREILVAERDLLTRLMI